MGLANTTGLSNILDNNIKHDQRPPACQREVVT